MHHAALDRPGPHDRHLDHQVVEVLGLAAAAASPSARATRSGTRRWCRPAGSSRRRPDPPAGTSLPMLAVECRSESSARRIAVSMPSASTSTLSSPSASRSSLSHWMTVRSGMAAFSTGTSSSSGPREITKPPTCCDRWRGKPTSVRASAAVAHHGLSGSKPASRRRSRIDSRPSHHASAWRVRSTCVGRRGRAPCPRRAPRSRPVADDRRRERGAVAAVLAVDVLDHFLAPLVLEVDVDVRRLVALAEMKRSNSIVHARRIDLGDAEA